MSFSREEGAACRTLIALALDEDLGRTGDLTSMALIPPDLVGRAVFVARAPGVVAGLPAARLAALTVDPALRFEYLHSDGGRVETGARIAKVNGLMRSILAAERTALNFLQHLSGIATLTRRFVDAVADLPSPSGSAVGGEGSDILPSPSGRGVGGEGCRILDTRKTIPGWRQLAKYAVRMGGGHNHRMGLHDGILIKDNHLAALGKEPSPLAAAIQAARDHSKYPVEVEVESLQQLDEALRLGPDIILLDNMSVDELREAVERRNKLCNVNDRVLLEASGGVTLENVRAIAATGVDRISVGALTHSAPALDIALDFEG
ncbi:MAG: nicotinate-nucleotide diphosphorylase [Gemmataceae bacterium]|nr:nicotinate-nucleotide diphosphorylase [Gemmataceae bacterium]MCI0741135.1 nicotinate-nucleotide diphosphorylase [Gemmataceae bacterium]